MFGIQFYPTPEWLVDKMLDKVNWKDVTSVLEPSAGKGDIVKGIRRLMNSTQTMMYYYITQSTKYDSGWNRQRLRALILTSLDVLSKKPISFRQWVVH